MWMRLWMLGCAALAVLWSAPAQAKTCMPWDARCALAPPAKIVSQCALGEEEAAPGRCCWRGQTWDEQALVCRGQATCDTPGLEVAGDQCLPDSPWMAHHQRQCQAGYLGDCWRWAQLIETLPDAFKERVGMPATALSPILRPLCDAGHQRACAHLGALLVMEWRWSPQDPPHPPYTEPPLLTEGMALLKKTCDAGIPDACFALARDTLRAPTRHKKILGWIGARHSMFFLDRFAAAYHAHLEEARSYYDRACALGHSLACHTLLNEQHPAKPLDTAQATRWHTVACHGRPERACALADMSASARGVDLPHLLRDVKSDAEAEGALRTHIEAIYRSCLSGSTIDCAVVEQLNADEPLFFHHPPLNAPSAAAQAARRHATLKPAPNTRDMRCLLGLSEWRDDDCGAAAMLAKVKGEARAKLLAYFARACINMDERSQHNGCPEQLVWAVAERPHVTYWLQSDNEPLHWVDPRDRAGWLSQELSFQTPWLRHLIRSSRMRRPPPAGSTIATQIAAATQLCVTERHMRLCQQLMWLAGVRGDIEGYKRLRAAQGELSWRHWSMEESPTVYGEGASPSSAQARRSTDELRERCEETKERCVTYLRRHDVLTRPASDKERRRQIFDMEGDEQIRLTPLEREQQIRLLAPACDAYSASACYELATLYKTLKDHAAAHTPLLRACKLGLNVSCEELMAITPDHNEARRLRLVLCSRNDRKSCTDERIEAAREAAKQEEPRAVYTRACDKDPDACILLIEYINDLPTRSKADNITRYQAMLRSCIDGRTCNGIRPLLEDLSKYPELTPQQIIKLTAEHLEKTHPDKDHTISDLLKEQLTQLPAKHAPAARKLLAQREATPSTIQALTIIPKGNDALKPKLVAELERRCIYSAAACVALWQAWQAGRATLELERGRLIGVMGCRGTTAKHCRPVAQSRMVGRPDGRALDEASALYVRACEARDVASCEALVALEREGRLAPPRRAAALTALWLRCLRDKGMCELLDAMEGRQ